MEHSIGTAIIVAAIVAGIVWFRYLKLQERKHRMDIIHRERVVAMEKGIPLPELPLDPPPTPKDPEDPRLLALIGVMMAMIGIGLMIAFALIPPEGKRIWPLGLPVLMAGLGLLLFYFLGRKYEV